MLLAPLVHLDHVATLRQARGTRYPDPVKAALDAEEAGADGITVHLREDRRHIQERDVLLLKDVPIWYELWRNVNGFPPDYYKAKVPDTKNKTKASKNEK